MTEGGVTLGVMIMRQRRAKWLSIGVLALFAIGCGVETPSRKTVPKAPSAKAESHSGQRQTSESPEVAATQSRISSKNTKPVHGSRKSVPLVSTDPDTPRRSVAQARMYGDYTIRLHGDRVAEVQKRFAQEFLARVRMIKSQYPELKEFPNVIEESRSEKNGYRITRFELNDKVLLPNSKAGGSHRTENGEVSIGSCPDNNKGHQAVLPILLYVSESETKVNRRHGTAHVAVWCLTKNPKLAHALYSIARDIMRKLEAGGLDALGQSKVRQQ
jgi:hypothetical protein